MDNLVVWNYFEGDYMHAENGNRVEATTSTTGYTGRGEDIVVKNEPLDQEGFEAEVQTKRIKSEAISDGEVNVSEVFEYNMEPLVDITVESSGGEEELLVDRNGDLASKDYDFGIISICPACGVEFETDQKWKEHIEKVHKFNTRRGLNFVQVDKLYHKCLQCNKKIAMYSIDNILKHKFTHLPFKRVKCKICLKEYKYRQDLMVHLRLNHQNDLLSILKVLSGDTLLDSRTRPAMTNHLKIKEVQENAVDIFRGHEDHAEIKKEPPTSDEVVFVSNEANSSAAVPNVNIYDDYPSRSSSRQSSVSAPNHTNRNGNLFEALVDYICPQCGSEFSVEWQWQQHINYAHNFETLSGLNFKQAGAEQYAQCLECDRMVHGGSVRNLQLHKFTHLPFRSWLRCRLCMLVFSGHKEIERHLLAQHRSHTEHDTDSQDAGLEDDDDYDDMDTDMEHMREERTVDHFEEHIDYLCPQCGKEFLRRRTWRRHIVQVHHLTDLRVLNFKVLNNHQVICLECNKVITNAYGVQNAQQHRFTHLPYKAFVRCRVCKKSYTDRKGLVKHLKSTHNIADVPTRAYPATSSSTAYSPALLTPTPAASSGGGGVRNVAPSMHSEIVKHANYTYEIKYLDENGDCDDIMDDAPVPELCFNGNYEDLPTVKCKQCPATFTSQGDLHLHVMKEHQLHDANASRRHVCKEVAAQTSRRHQSLSNNAMPSQAIPKQNAKRGRQTLPEAKQRTTSQSVNSTIAEAADSDRRSNNVAAAGQQQQSSSTATMTTTTTTTINIEKHFCYLCPDCGCECVTQMQWRRHINDVHNYDQRLALNFRPVDKFRYKCMECKDIVSGAKLKALQDHKFRHLPFRFYIKCLLCGTTYNHKPNMISHLSHKHNIIDLRPMRDDGTTIHELRASTIANTIASTARVLATRPPAKTLTKGGPPTASNVAGVAASAAAATIADDLPSYHNAVDHPTIVYFCPQCNEKFTSHNYWRRHIVDEHNLNSRQGLNFRQIDEHHFMCLQCYKRVTVTHTKGAIGQLQSHKFRHLPYKSFKCTTCRSEFVRKQMFFKHLNKSTNLCDSNKTLPAALDDDDVSGQPQQPNIVTNNVGRIGGDGGGGGSSGGPGAGADDDDVLVLADNDDKYDGFGLYYLLCPQCGLQFERRREWRVHINSNHDLNNRDALNFNIIGENLSICLQCLEHVNSNKIHYLRLHKFRHLAFAPYIQCRYCKSSYYHTRNMMKHAKQKHRDVLANSRKLFKAAAITMPDWEESSIDSDEEPFLLD